MTDPHTSPSLVLTGNLWSLSGYPQPQAEWAEEDKIRFFANAGFQAVTMAGRPGLGKWLHEHFGLRLCGFFQADSIEEMEPAYLREVLAGAETINCFLGAPTTPAPLATAMLIELDRLERAHAVPVHVETHRATMLEVPEFAFAAYQACAHLSGRWPRLCHDDSHVSIVKHLSLPQLSAFFAAERNPQLLRRSHQMHLRPFNGHHAQVPVLDHKGIETPEFLAWLEYVRPLISTWSQLHKDCADLWVVPELGPLVDGYQLSTAADVLDELSHCAARIRGLFAH
jgi:hypothetical protein